METLVNFYNANSAVLNGLAVALVIDLIGAYISKSSNIKANSILGLIKEGLEKLVLKKG